MIEKKALKKTTAIVILCSVFFAVLELYGIRSSFYLWEFFFDGKILLMMIIVIALWRKGEIIFSFSHRTLFAFQWKKNVLLFFAPLALYGVPACIGLLSGDVRFNTLDNAITLILATMFDIPAMYVFSFTTVFLEEILIRGLFFSTLHSITTPIKSTVLAGILWLVYSASDVAGMEKATIVSYTVALLHIFSIGFFCSAIVLGFRSILLTYSFRVGMLALTPLILSSEIVESDPFFVTQSIIFNAEGLIASAFLLAFSVIILRRNLRVPENTPV